MRQRLEAGFTIIELLIVVAVIGIIAALAVPGLMRARLSGNEASAVATLRTLNSAQFTYSSSCGNGFFASNLTILGDAPPGGTPFISPDLSAGISVEKSGYTLTMARGTDTLAATINGCNPSGVAGALFTGYYASNQPTTGMTGSRWYWTNTFGTLYFSIIDEFDGETLGNARPSVGTPLQ